MKFRVFFLIATAACFMRAATAQPAEPPLSIPYKLPAIAHGSVDFGDMDGDGDLDVAVIGMTSNGPILSIWQLGDSSWAWPGSNDVFHVNVFRRASVNAHPVSHGAVRWGDFDGDGDDDLLVTGLANYVERTTHFIQPVLDIYENNGVTATLGGRVLSLRRIPLPGLHRSAADWGDFDGDGDLDFVAAGLPSLTADQPIIRLYRNDGGTFVPVDTEMPGVFSGDLAWADYDSDGDLDLALTGDSGGGVFITRLYRNEGGRFIDSGLELPGLAFGSLDWGDYDGDGDPDLLLTGGRLDPRFLRGVTRVYVNQSGSLVDGGFDFEGHALGEARWGDADRDGDLDVFAVGVSQALTAPVLRLYTNDGSRFVPTWNETGMRYAAMSVGDYNGDGDADVALSGELIVGGLGMRFLMNRDFFECVVPSWVRVGQPVGNC